VTQRTAAVLAEKFNELCEEKSLSVPKVKYLGCLPSSSLTID